MENKTVYLVTEGDYSDYHICGVFSTKELAEAYFANTARAKDFHIEEQTLDAPALVLKQIYSEILVLEDGSRWVGSTPDHTGAEHFAYRGEEVSEGYRGSVAYLQWGLLGTGRYDPKPSHVAAKSAVSQEHATKLAAEARQAYLRNRDMDIRGMWQEVND